MCDKRQHIHVDSGRPIPGVTVYMSSPEAETVALPLPAELTTGATQQAGENSSVPAPGAQDASGIDSAPSPQRQLPAQDAHRLALQAKLTELGVPPTPGDRTALTQLSALDDQLITTVLNWLSCAADPGSAANWRCRAAGT